MDNPKKRTGSPKKKAPPAVNYTSANAEPKGKGDNPYVSQIKIMEELNA